MPSIEVRNGSRRVVFRHGGRRHSLNLGRTPEPEAVAKARQVDYLLLRLSQGAMRIPDGVSVVEFMRFDGNPPDHSHREEGGLASLQLRGESFHVMFHHEGRRHSFAVGKVERAEAEMIRSRVDFLLLRIRQGLLARPDPDRIVEFVRLDGNLPPAATPAERTTLGTLRDRYLEANAPGLEANTVRTARIHFAHLVATLGESRPAQGVRLQDLQAHVARRHGLGIAAVTIRKEVDTLRSAWNWGTLAELVDRPWPGAGLRLPRTADRPPFRTAAEIRAILARDPEGGGGDPWECLYLTPGDLADLLATSARDASRPWVHPAIATAAHTGARRSELIRAEVGDVDLEACVFTVREKKRARGRQTFRRVPISASLAATLGSWLETHPGGSALFCGPDGSPITVDQAHDQFRRALARSPWSVVPGWHTLRHSFASICAGSGIDQRIINAWMGHQTEEQQRRYQHLFPEQQRTAMRAAFG